MHQAAALLGILRDLGRHIDEWSNAADIGWAELGATQVPSLRVSAGDFRSKLTACESIIASSLQTRQVPLALLGLTLVELAAAHADLAAEIGRAVLVAVGARSPGASGEHRIKWTGHPQRWAPDRV